jgi:hypothetical protein
MTTQLPQIDVLRRSLKLPVPLAAMIQSGMWRHPGAYVLRRKIPFITDPLVVLQTFDQMVREGYPLMGRDSIEDPQYCEYRGSQIGLRELPWIDVEKTLFIMCNERIGDDVGIALDYRHSLTEPRVVGGDWHSSPGGIIYRLIANNFAEFAKSIRLSIPETPSTLA